MRNLLRYGYPLLMLVGVNGAIIALAGSGAPKLALIGVVLAAIALSFAAERAIPYERAWNRSHDDAGRDVAHVLVNESLMLASLAVIPLVAAVRGAGSWWPHALPFWAQVLLAVLVADLGITAVHMASHRWGWLWRLHAVHHSVTRCYGLNGLMKHPLHQTLETIGGVAPLLVLGMPVPVASALAAMVAVQLLLQHSNADYRVGPLRSVLALNEGHRFHHQREAGAGDVDFGLFTLLWDHLFGTYVLDRRRRFTSADLGMAAKPDYPTGYRAQLVAPFTEAGGCGEMGPLPRRTVSDRLQSAGRRSK